MPKGVEHLPFWNFTASHHRLRQPEDYCDMFDMEGL